MKERMEKAGGMENFDKVVKLFTPGPCPSNALRLLAKGYDAVVYGMAVVAAFLMAAMMVVITLDVILQQPRLPELGALLHLHRVRAADRAVPRRAVAGAREGPYLRRDPADARCGRARAPLHDLAIGAVLHRGLPDDRLVRLRVTIHDYLQAEKDVRSLDMPRWMVVVWIPLSFLMMAIEFARFLWRRENFLAPLSDITS